MTLQSWCDNGWLFPHNATTKEITKVLGVADRDLVDCASRGFSDDNRFSIAYKAALACAKAALAAAGYRATTASGHYRMIASLEHTLHLSPDDIEQFDSYRKKRNISEYEESGLITSAEASGMVEFARKLRILVEDWLRANHPHLLAAND
jgi:uncharacterized protein (UPF0332 family)